VGQWVTGGANRTDSTSSSGSASAVSSSGTLNTTGGFITLTDTTAPQVTAQISEADIGRVRVKLSAPIVAERYEQDRALGAFILFDPATGDTVAGGVIREWA